MPHCRNVLVTSGNVRAMLICWSSYAIRGFPFILLFAFYAGISIMGKSEQSYFFARGAGGGGGRVLCRCQRVLAGN